MEAPPTFSAPAKKSGGSKLWVWILAGVGLCCVLPALVCGGAALWGLNKFKDLGACFVNLDAVSKSFREYSDSHDGKLPPAATWQDDLKSSVAKNLNMNGKDTGPFKLMKADGAWGCTNDAGVQYGIAYNTTVAGKKIGEIKQEDVLFYEVPAPKQNQAAPYKPQDPATGRQVFGKPFGWIFVTVGGEKNLHGVTGDQPMSNTSVNLK